MVVCRFFEQGNCRFGNNCKNEHITSNQGGFGRGRGGFNTFNSARGGFGNFQNNQTRGGFANNGNRGPFNQRGGVSTPNRPRERWSVDTRIIKADLTAERPIWPFSCYAPKSDAPRQLIEGKLEISAEEMRVEAYKLIAQGKGSDITQIESIAAAEMQKSIQQILENLDGAVKYVADGRDFHPNRYDIEDGVATQATETASSMNTPPASNPFGAPASAAAANPFGQPSQAASSSPFGQAKSMTPFGQPSASPFASAVNSQQTSMNSSGPFGQASQTSTSSAFGQPSMLGQNKPNPFGQAMNTGAGNANSASPFGAQSTTSPFGQTATVNPFGQPQSIPNDAPMMSSSAQHNPFSNASQPFGQPQQQTAANPFGQPPQPTTSQSTTFRPPPQTQSASPFAPPLGPKASPFGQPSQSTAQNPFASARSQSQSSPFANSAQAVTNGSSGALSNRSIFDKGVPTQPHVDDPPQAMYGNDDDAFKAAYDHAKQHGTFESNIMPMLPPKTSWISYDNL